MASERARWREREAEGVILRYIKVNMINIASRIQGRIEEPIKVNIANYLPNTKHYRMEAHGSRLVPSMAPPITSQFST